MTALVMFLPHIPSNTSQHLPALFNIYTRLLFWDRVRRGEGISSFELKDSSNDIIEDGWTKLPYLTSSDDESVPELLHYFTFLYGLYPINFMSYIRKPHKYLAHAKYLGIELDYQPVEVRQRSEPFRQAHLLHPNFFTLTIESELTDSNRWVKSDTADVVAECMALYVPCEDLQEQIPQSNSKIVRSDQLAISLPTKEFASCLADLHTRHTLDQSSNIFNPIDEYSHSAPDSHLTCSRKTSLILESSSRNNCPDDYHHRKAEVLGPTKLRKKKALRIMKNDSVASLALSNHHESHIDSYFESLNQDSISRPSSSQQKESGSLTLDMRLTYLYREIQLLRNDLNFERYLKQQHLSHIGQLRRKQIREARSEAETQNVITSNRTLKLKLEETQRLNMQLRKEFEKSKTHCRKWEAELSAKLRILREEQKKWSVERQNMTQDLELARENQEVMKRTILQLEASELKSKQKATHAKNCYEELIRLRKQIEDLNSRVRIYEVNEEANKVAKEGEITAEARVIMLEAELEARDRELLDAKELFQKEISKGCKRSQEASITQRYGSHSMQNMIDSAVASSRNRIIELEKSYKNLLARYSELQDEHYGFQNTRDKLVNVDKYAHSDYAIYPHQNPGKERAVKRPSSEGNKGKNDSIKSFQSV